MVAETIKVNSHLAREHPTNANRLIQTAQQDLPSFFEFAFVTRFDHALNIFLRPLQVRLVSGLLENISSM